MAFSVFLGVIQHITVKFFENYDMRLSTIAIFFDKLININGLSSEGSKASKELLLIVRGNHFPDFFKNTSIHTLKYVQEYHSI